MPVTDDQVDVVEQWVKGLWENYAAHIVSIAGAARQDIALDEFKAKRELLVEARAALSEVRNLSQQKG